MFPGNVFRSLFVFSFILPLLAGCATTASLPASEVGSGTALSPESRTVVARVNGSEITRADLDQAKRILFLNKPGMQIPPLLQREFEKQTLDQMISTELLFQAGRKLETGDPDTRAEENVAEIRKRFSNPDDYTRELKKIGLSEQGLLESARRDLAVIRFVETTIAPTVQTASDDDIRKYYDRNPETFRQPEMVRASHILIGIDASTGADAKQAAREKAEKIRRQLVDGADFATLARGNSTCPSKSQGGDLGYFTKGKMVPAFEKAAFALKQGETSDVVESVFGYHVIRVTDRKEAGTISLADAREKIRAYLAARNLDAATAAYVADARKQAKIEILLP